MAQQRTLEERLSLAVHMLLVAKSAARVCRQPIGPHAPQAEIEGLMGHCYKLDKAARLMEEIGGWPPGFEPVRDAASTFATAWSEQRDLRNAFEHPEDRVSDFSHKDRGQPAIESFWMVRGLKIPKWGERGFHWVENFGPLSIEYLWKTYSLKEVVAALYELEKSLRDSLEQVPDPTGLGLFRIDPL